MLFLTSNRNPAEFQTPRKSIASHNTDSEKFRFQALLKCQLNQRLLHPSFFSPCFDLIHRLIREIMNQDQMPNPGDKRNTQSSDVDGHLLVLKSFSRICTKGFHFTVHWLELGNISILGPITSTHNQLTLGELVILRSWDAVTFLGTHRTHTGACIPE